MSDTIIIFIIILALIAALLRADFALTIVYLLLGIYIVSRWWSSRALKAVQVHRNFPSRIFLGEKIQAHLEISNSGVLPVVWLKFHESLPVGLNASGSPRKVLSLGPKDKARLEYTLFGRKRGYYPIGPLSLYSGDVFGILEQQTRKFEAQTLIVYPKIIPLNKVFLPSRSPLGNLRHRQPIFEDPSRVFGKREYVSGDSLRRVDWKATASTGKLQVKLFEPSIALETAIFLNLNANDFVYRKRFDAAELAIVVAASLANWIISQRQPVGLYTNGLDPLSEETHPQPVAPRHGRAHLMRILDVLARIQSVESYDLDQLLQREIANLSWGTTLILITPHIDDRLFDRLFQARRSGLNAVLIPCGPVKGLADIRRRAEQFGFPLHHILDEGDLDIWK